jgi:hypothetical protein
MDKIKKDLDFLSKGSITKLTKLGTKIGRFTVVGVNKEKYLKHHAIYYDCICECGETQIVHTSDLHINGTHMCKICSKIEGANKNKKHGLVHHPLYKKHRSMIDRCTNPNHIKNKKNYQDIGITVCEEWIGENGFINFYNWAMDNKYEKGLSLERINVLDGYNPKNCKWIELREQYFNKRNSFLLEDGRNLSKVLYELNRSSDYDLVASRIKIGWSLEDALNKPNRLKKLKDVKNK